jgi:hypothetical protein
MLCWRPAFRERTWDFHPGLWLGVPSITFCLFVLWCLFFYPHPWLQLESGSNSTLNCSPKPVRQTSFMNPNWSHPRLCQGEIEVTATSKSPPPASLLSAHTPKGLTSASAKPWQLWKLRGLLWLPHRSPHCAQLPSHGASSKNVFLIFIVHSVTDVCTAIIVIPCTCVVMKWVPFKPCQVMFFFLSETQIYYFYLCFSYFATLLYFISKISLGGKERVECAQSKVCLLSSW